MEKYKYMSLINKEMVLYKLPKRLNDYHKGNFGKLFCLCGSRNMPGAAMFVISAASRMGVGSILACVGKSVYGKISQPEPTFLILEENEEGFINKSSIMKLLNGISKCSAGVVGCGLGWNEDTKFLVYELIRKSKIPLVIDADGINVISDNINILKESKSQIILTPHLKEMSRLLKLDIKTIKRDRVKYALQISKKYKVTIVVKGPRSVVCDECGNVFVNTSGNVGLAKGGSGDVLSGMIGSLLGQKMTAVDAAVCGVFLHGLSGDNCKERYSSVSMIPSDIINELPNIFAEFKM